MVVCTNLILPGTTVFGEYFHVAGEKALVLCSSFINLYSLELTIMNFWLLVASIVLMYLTCQKILSNRQCGMCSLAL